MSTIQEKQETLKTELETVVKQYNELGETRQKLLQKASELNGALKVLNELDVDQPTDTETT